MPRPAAVTPDEADLRSEVEDERASRRRRVV
jgi:hypothetical protein